MEEEVLEVEQEIVEVTETNDVVLSETTTIDYSEQLVSINDKLDQLIQLHTTMNEQFAIAVKYGNTVLSFALICMGAWWFVRQFLR